MKLNLPKEFIWGTATAAHQVEGNNTNSDFWLLENTKNTVFAEPSGITCDQWNRYDEDIKLMADHSIQSYRLSIEWARIQPSETEFSQEAIDHYKKVLDCCHAHGLKTCVTYQHFTSPLWFTARGGWEKSENTDFFSKYVERVTTELGDKIDTICTINEANLTAQHFFRFPIYPENGMKTMMPFVSDAAKACGSDLDNFGPFLFGHPFKIRDCMMQAHVNSVPIIKGLLNKNQPVGITLAIEDYQCIEGGEESRNKAHAESVDICLDQIKDDDFVGIQMYTRHIFGPEGVTPNKEREMLVMDYEYYPESLENVIKYVAPKINCPIIVTENGIGTDDDKQRISYITTALEGLQRCLDDGIDIRGYYYWSFLDNFEWVYGYKPRFGLVKVNRETQERKAKESLKFYQKIINDSK